MLQQCSVMYAPRCTDSYIHRHMCCYRYVYIYIYLHRYRQMMCINMGIGVDVGIHKDM